MSIPSAQNLCYNMLMFTKLFRFLKKPSASATKTVFSPDGRIECSITLKDGVVTYSVKKDSKILVRPSHLGFSFRGQEIMSANLALIRSHEQKHDETWEAPWGEQRLIRNHYHELALYFAELEGAERLLTLRFRVFNDGVAFRYEIPPQPGFQRLTIDAELTEFNISYNSFAWSIPAFQPDRYEYNYERHPIYELTEAVHTPLTIEDPASGKFLSLHEAALYDYGSMTLRFSKRGAFVSEITPLSDGTKAHITLPFNTPWRVIMIADAAVDLITNRMIYNLNDPPKNDFSWVKPIKFLGIWWAMYVGEWTWAPGDRHGATTEHAKSYIDSCRRLGIDGLLVEGWNNGWEGDWLLNGDKTDFLHPMKDFDLDEVAEYAHAHKIELVGHHETVGFVDNYEEQIEDAYKYYARHGIRYIKPGYAGSMMTINGRKEYHHSQLGVRHYQRALELAAKYRICLNVHEPIKGTGIERTWPNLLTREGARGQEYEGGALSPSHGTIIPFTRLLAGGMDYTSGIFDVTNATKRCATTIVRQIAYYITIYSGMQMAADRPVFYEKRYPNLYKFIRDLPLSWEKTLPLAGEIGQYYVVARQKRNSNDWFIGGVTNEHGRRVHISLDFLEVGDYDAEIYRDGAAAHYRDNALDYKIEKRRVTRSEVFDLYLAPGGGFCIRLKKR